MNEQLNSYIQNLVSLYTSHANAEFAEWSKKYMKNQFPFLGIRTPIRRKVTKQFVKEHGVPSNENLEKVIQILWDMPEREYQRAALDLIEMKKKSLRPSDMTWLEKLLVTKSWWDTIDVLSPHIMGYLFQTYPELISRYPDRWIESENIWLQRSAILYQLFYRGKMDDERLFRYILRRAGSNEFFVQKAIGWVLREYAKTRPDSVKNFVARRHELKPLSRREALKHFDNNK
ncbi:DNA alkylation repair enzyme [Bacillus smithii]|nr:DNA alkylation repair enzyme [Bacillus smithii]